MLLWEFLLVIGIFFLVLEMFTPMMFFLNFALASFVTAGAALYTQNFNYLVPFFVIVSAIFLFFLRPFLMNRMKKNPKTGVEEKYIGKTAKVTENITASSGSISIYDERWNARTLNGEEIPAGSEVKIVKNESLVFYVEKI